jgi:hypothetical protein
MALKVLFLRGTSAQNAAYTGADGELTLDITKRSLRIHDGVTAGGHEILGSNQVQLLINALADRIDANDVSIGDINTTIGEIQTELSTKFATAMVGAANGAASLDANGKVPLSQLSDSIVGQVEYRGTWDAAGNLPVLPETPTEKGIYYVTSANGTFAGITFTVGDWIISNGTAWEKVDNTDAVASVAGRTGTVVLNKSDVGLSVVDNTSDVDKPVSTAQQAALDLKANLAGAAFTGTVTAPTPTALDQSTKVATTEFVAARIGELNTGVSGVVGTDPIRVDSTDPVHPVVSILEATQSLKGALSAADKIKLDGIEAGSQVNTVNTVNGYVGAVVLVKSDVGLGSVENYGITTAEEAAAGQSNVKYATPLATRQFVEGMGFVQNGSTGLWTLDQGSMV